MLIKLPDVWYQILEAIHAFQYAGVPMSEQMRIDAGALPSGGCVDHGTMKLAKGVPESWLLAYLLPEPVLEQQRLRGEVTKALPELQGLGYLEGFTGSPISGPCGFLRPDGVVVTIDGSGTGVRVGPYPQASQVGVGSNSNPSSSWLTPHQMVNAEGRPLAQSPLETHWRLTKDGLAAAHAVAGRGKAGGDTHDSAPLRSRLVAQLATDLEQGFPVCELPPVLLNADLLTVLDADGVVEFGRRNHSGSGPSDLRIERGWTWGSLTGPNKKPMRQIVAEAADDDARIRLHVRLTSSGRIEASRAALVGSAPADATQSAYQLPHDAHRDGGRRLNEIARKLDEFAGRPTIAGLAGAAGLAGILLFEARKAGAFDPVTWIELDPCFRQYPAISSGAPLEDGRQLFACLTARLAQSSTAATAGCSFRPEPPHPRKSYDFDWLRETLRALARLVRSEGARLGGCGSVANAPKRSGPEYDLSQISRHDGDDAGLDPGTSADESLSPSRVRARAVYEWAIEVIDGADRMPIAVLLPRIFERLDAELERAPDGSAEFEKFTELRSSLPDNTETFGRYIREAGIKRYNRKGERVRRQARRPRRD